MAEMFISSCHEEQSYLRKLKYAVASITNEELWEFARNPVNEYWSPAMKP